MGKNKRSWDNHNDTNWFVAPSVLVSRVIQIPPLLCKCGHTPARTVLKGETFGGAFPTPHVFQVGREPGVGGALPCAGSQGAHRTSPRRQQEGKLTAAIYMHMFFYSCLII